MMNVSDVYRSAEPRKKGILYLIFGRLFIVVLLLALQVGMHVSLYGSKSFRPFSPC